MRQPFLALAVVVTVAACSSNPPPDQSPLVAATTVTTAEDTAVEFTVDATDPEGRTLTFTTSAPPAHGGLVVAGDRLTYTPAANFNGADSATITVDDGKSTASAVVTITVTPVNDAPVAVADSLAANENTSVTVSSDTLVSNDTDVDGDALVVTAVSGATHGTATAGFGSITFTPASNFTGDATFDYIVFDGALTATGHVTVAVGGVNHPPVAADDSATTAEDTELVVTAATLLANDTDADGQTLALSAVGNPTRGTVTLTGGEVHFQPAANSNGTASFEYTVSDGASSDTGVVTVTVSSVNDAPAATDATASTAEDTAVAIAATTLLASATDVEGDTLTLIAVNGATNGAVALVGTMVTFTPAGNFNGDAGFDYTLSDGALTATAHVAVSVTAVNDAPVAVADNGTTSVNAAVTFADATLLANDTDVDGPSLSITSVGGAVNGAVSRSTGVTTFTPTANFTGVASFTYVVSDGTLNATGTVTLSVGAGSAPVAVDDTASTAEDTAAVIAAATLRSNDSDADGDPLTITAVSNPSNGTVTLVLGTVTFTPATNFNGVAGFDYTVSDGLLSGFGHVTVTVTSVPDAPVAVADAVTAAEDTGAVVPVGTLTANDTDADGDSLNVTAVSNPTNGTVVLSLGVVTFTPTAEFSGTGGFDYTVTDGTTSATAHVTVTITPVDDVPVANPDSSLATEDTGVAIDVLGNDTGLGDGISITGMSTPTHGTVTPSATTVQYMPEANFNGTDSFTYTITDSDGDTASATVTITISAVNDAPVANNQTATTSQSTPVTIALSASDIDSPSVTFAVGAQPTGGTLGAVTSTGPFAATVVYTPAGAFTGNDSFTFTANDGTAASAAATVGITVNVLRPTVTATLPVDGATGARPTTPVSVTFSAAMNPATLIAQTAAGACSGTLQVSGDNFTTCIGFTAAAPVMSSGNTVATLQPQAALVSLGVFKLRVDSTVTNASGTDLGTTFTQGNGFTIATDGSCAASLVISQVYGSGGLAGAAYNADYVELHNPGLVPVSLNGMALQYSSAAGTSWSARALPNVSVPPGAYFLVKLGPVGGTGVAPPADFTTATTLDMAGSNGKLALTQTTTALPALACPLNLTLDFYGYGTANCFEGTTAAPALGTAVAGFRSGAGCTDNNTSNTDFANVAPSPRNLATATRVCECTANETDKVAELDFCNLQFPITMTVAPGQSTANIFAQVFESGVTEPNGANAQIRAQIGFGPSGVNPATTAGYSWINASSNVQVGNNDEYLATFTAPGSGTYGYTSRFTRDGTNWTYCDTNGAGSNAGLTFESSVLGVLTVP